MKHRVVLILLIVIISFIAGFHHLYGFYFHGVSYAPFYPGGSFNLLEEAYAYMTRTRQILNGNLTPTDSIFEYRNNNTPFISIALPTYVMAALAKLFGSVETAFIATDFFLPALIFLIVLYFNYWLTKNRMLSITSALSLILVRDLFMYLPYPEPTFRFLFLTETRINDLPITRNFHPQVSIIFYLLALIAVYFALYKKQKKRYFILAGLLVGFLIYDYIYFWTTMVFGLGILLIVNLKDSEGRKVIFFIIAISFLIVLPYFYNNYRFNQNPAAPELFLRMTNERTVFPLARAVRFLVFTPLLYILIRKKDRQFYFFNSFILAGSLLPDLSYLVFRRDLESDHWIWMTVLPLAAIYYPILIEQYIFRRIGNNIKFLFYVLAGMSFIFYALKIQLHSALKYVPQQKHNSIETSLFSYLRTLPKLSVVASYPEVDHPGDKNEYIPAFTDNYTFTAYATMTVAPVEEIIERNIILLSFMKTEKQIIISDLDLLIDGAYTKLNAPQADKRVAIKERIIKKIGQIKTYCHKYRMDYVVLPRGQNIRKTCYGLTKVFENQSYFIFKVLK